MHRMRVIEEDITTLSLDAIVNAANESLLGGGGVDGAIHRAAGPELLAECRTFGGYQTGDTRITAGYALQVKYVIHTVGPIWQGGDADEDARLASCYQCCLEVALEHRVVSIAFPAISTGVYRFPIPRACAIAVRTVAYFIQNEHRILEVVFCCFGSEVSAAVRAELIALPN